MSTGIKSFVTDLRPVSEQVGEHILKALKEPQNVAVLTSIVPDFPTDRIVSVPISPDQLPLIYQVLHRHQLAILGRKEAEDQESTEDRKIGFQAPEDEEEE